MKRTFLALAGLGLFSLGLSACASKGPVWVDPAAQPQQEADKDFKGRQAAPNDKSWQGNPLHINADLGTYSLVTNRKRGRDLHPFVHVNEGSQSADLYFSSDSDGRGYDIYLKNPVGTALRKITSLTGNEYWPNVSKDGRWLAFGSDRKGNFDIYVMDLKNQSSPPINVTMGHTSNDIHPTWSNDGTCLVYASYSPSHGDYVLKYVRLETGNAATMQAPVSATSMLAFGDVAGDLPNDSEKDDTMANASMASISVTSRGTLMSNQGTTITGMHPSFRPGADKQELVYQDYIRDGHRWNAIKIFNMDEGSITQIPITEDYGAIQPRWSPDGKRIVFATVAKTSQKELTDPSGADGFGITDVSGAGVADLRNPTDRTSVSDPIWVRVKGEDRLYFSASNSEAEILASVRLTQGE